VIHHRVIDEHEAQTFAEPELDRLNRELLERLNASGRLLLTQTELRAKYVLRMSIGARTTEERHVRAAWEQIRHTAAELLEESR